MPTFEARRGDAMTTRAFILYDGTCGLCGQFFPRFGHIFEHRGLRPMPLQAPDAEQIAGVPREQLMLRMHVVTADRRIFAGLDAVLFIAGAFCWLRPIVWLARFRPIYRYLNRAYGWIAQNRYRFFGTCSI